MSTSRHETSGPRGFTETVPLAAQALVASISRLGPLVAWVLVVICLLSCHRDAPAARLQTSPQAITLPYPHSVPLDLTWLPLISLNEVAGGLTVFVHLIDQEGEVQRTFDHAYPAAWTTGKEVTYSLDLYQSVVGAPLPPGSYGLTLGLYSASGHRWALEVGGPEVDGREYTVAEVTIPHPVTPTTRFTFSGAWQPPQDTETRQVVATRWLTADDAELEIWGLDQPGEAVLSWSILRLREPQFRLLAEGPETAPAVAFRSDCDGAHGRLSGYGSHEIRISVAALAPAQKCTIRFDPGTHFISAEGSRTYSALLESATWVPAAVDTAAGELPHRHRITRSPEEYRFSLSRAATPETLLLRNAGDEIVVAPRVIVNGRRDWSSSDRILAGILEPGDSDRDKAMAIWEFLVANRHHDFPTLHRLEPHDPVRLLNVYGYGYCDDAARGFVDLAMEAGLQARIWHLGGHVVSEAFYDGDWHMFDVDGEVFYLADDGKTITGVQELSSRPDLIRRQPSGNPLYFDTEHLVELYTSRGDNWIAKRSTPGPRHVMTFDLRPGESILRSRQNWGMHVTSHFRKEPVAYGNGRFVFEPVLRDDLFRKGAAEVTNVRVETVGEDRRDLVFGGGDDAGSARLVYDFVGPYPFLGGQVRIAGELRGAGTVELELSAYGKEWSHVWTSTGPGEVDALISLDELLARDSRRPVYMYSLRMSYGAQAEGSHLRVESLRFENVFQLAPNALPSFGEGINEVLYVDAGSDERQVELVFGFGGR